MEKIKHNVVFLATGGIGYAVIELLWRGRTHWSMMLAGGICFLLFSKIAIYFKGYSLILKALICAVCVTAVELVFGIVFNIMLDMHVWDYSGIPFNFLGQICPAFSLAWAGLALIFLPIAEKLNEKLIKQ